MAPVSLPAPVSERFLIEGTGAIALTEVQRGARSLSVTIEKVRPTNSSGVGLVIPAYYNQKWPEPQSHWGYFQLMMRDFVSSGGPLSYRREVIIERDNWVAEILSRLRCYLEKDHDYNTQAYEAILGSLGESGPGGGTPNIDDLKVIWELSLESQLFPTHPETAVWYQLADGWKAQIVITYQPYAAMNCGIEAQSQPPAKVPGAGESGPSGQRESPPVPAGRQTDPLSDNQSPPSDAPGGPPVPEQVPPPPEGATRTTFRVLQALSGLSESSGCIAPPPEVAEFTVIGLRRNSEITVALQPGDGDTGLPCGATRYRRTFSLSGVGIIISVLYNGSAPPVLLPPVYT